MVASSALLLALGTSLTFFGDSWAFLLQRDGSTADLLLRPHNEHIVVLPVALQELAVEWFGTGSDMPSRVLLTAMLSGTAILLFVHVRRRVGAWPALFSAAILLFLGSGWENLLWPFQISLVGSMLAGLASLLALERADRRGDLAACGLLTVSIASSSLGVSFAVGAVADLLLRRRDRGVGRAWIAAIPLLLYGAWYVAYGRDAESAASLANLLTAPLFVVESVTASAASLLGLRALAGGIDAGAPVVAMIVVGALFVALIAWMWRRGPQTWRPLLRRGPASPLWPIAATALSFWFLAALNEAPGRSPFASRYMYIGAVLLILLAANILAGVRIGRRGLAVMGAVAAVAVGLNTHLLLEGHDRLRRESVLTRANLGALEIAEPTVASSFWLDPGIAGTSSLINVTAGPYLDLVGEHGSPAYRPDELIDAPEAGRRQADVVLAHALPVTLTRHGAAAMPRTVAKAGRCVTLTVERVEVPLGAGLTAIRPAGGATTLVLHRFAPPGVNPIILGELSGASVARLRLPRDGSSRPWYLGAVPPGGVRVCSESR